MEITGKIINVLTPVLIETKNGQIQKTDFIVETDDMYPNILLISFFENKQPFTYLINSKVKVSFNSRVKEFNGKFFNNITAWRIEEIKEVEKTTPQVQSEFEEDDLPF